MTPNYCLQKPDTGVFTNWMKLSLIIFTKVECHRSGRILELHTDDCCLHTRIRVDSVHDVSRVTWVTVMRNSISNWEFKCEMTTKIYLLQWYSTCRSIKTLYILVQTCSYHRTPECGQTENHFKEFCKQLHKFSTKKHILRTNMQISFSYLRVEWYCYIFWLTVYRSLDF